LWIAFPDIPWGSLGWRMGFGEAHANDWMPWFKSLSDEERLAYVGQWPEPEGWVGFYSMLTTGATPPHIVEKNQKIEAAGGVLSPDEVRVTDYYRILWLLRHHLKRAGNLKLRHGESWAELWISPEGVKWRMSALEPHGMELAKVSDDEV
jgi:hypothetical protein